jgi:hypothetical protein
MRGRGGASITCEVKSLLTTICVSLLNGLPLRYGSIANCNTSTETPVTVPAKSPCATRVIEFVVFMCAYPVD